MTTLLMVAGFLIGFAYGPAAIVLISRRLKERKKRLYDKHSLESKLLSENTFLKEEIITLRKENDLLKDLLRFYKDLLE